MPADYNSAARALAIPTSPNSSPSPDRQRSQRPQWSRLDSQSRISFNSRRTNQSTSSRYDTYRVQAIRSANIVYKRFMTQFLKLSPLQRVLVVIAMVAMNVFGILFLIYNEKIFSYLAPAAQKWHAIPFGWVILWCATFISAFPPLIGYSTTLTISGFVYGFPGGWFIVASATVAGSLGSFIASRTVLSSYVHRLVGEDKRFQALALTLKHDGLKVLCMIRLCPLPYSLSNAAISTFPTVHPLSYALATTIVSPKLLIHVFIGSRLAQIAESGGTMDAGTKAINWISIILGSILGAAVGYIIYQKTMQRAKELEVEEIANTAEEGRGGSGVGSDATNAREAGRGYTDSLEGDEDAAVLMDPDDISLWGDDAEQGYRDGFADDDDTQDVFAKGDVSSDPEARRKGSRK